MMIEFVSLPAIAGLCAVIISTVKSFMPDTTHKFLPIVSGALGMVLGFACFFTMPGFIPADSWLGALGTGLVSGLSATGAHQLIHQQVKGA